MWASHDYQIRRQTCKICINALPEYKHIVKTFLGHLSNVCFDYYQIELMLKQLTIATRKGKQ